MDNLRFSWDPRKDRANQRKHGVSFAEAKSVFFDEYARLIVDPEHSEDEDRFILLGVSAKLRLLVASHTYRVSDEEIRIVSARKANRKERGQYRRFQR